MNFQPEGLPERAGGRSVARRTALSLQKDRTNHRSDPDSLIQSFRPQRVAWPRASIAVASSRDLFSWMEFFIKRRGIIEWSPFSLFNDAWLSAGGSTHHLLCLLSERPIPTPQNRGARRNRRCSTPTTPAPWPNGPAPATSSARQNALSQQAEDRPKRPRQPNRRKQCSSVSNCVVKTTCGSGWASTGATRTQVMP